MESYAFARRRTPWRRRTVITLLVAMMGCDAANCVQVPCALPIAIEAVVMSASGSPLPGLVVDVSSALTGRIPCDLTSGRCVIAGPAGTYTLRFSAPGYQLAERSVTVAAVRATGACGCEGARTQQLQLTLVPL